MKGTKIPQIIRHAGNGSISLFYRNPHYSLLWLHGLGDEAKSFLPLFSHLQSPIYNNTLVRIMQAPRRYISLNQQESCAWFDIRSSQRFSVPEEQAYDLGQLSQSTSLIEEECREEESQWMLSREPESKINPQHRVFVGGYGQGAVAALNYALSAQKPPAGVIAVNGYLLKHTDLKNLGKLPILLLHGQKEEIIRESEAKVSYSPLLQNEALVDYQIFPQVSKQMTIPQLIRIRKWLQQNFEFISKHYEQEQNKK